MYNKNDSLERCDLYLNLMKGGNAAKMSKKINEKFIDAYNELDRNCGRKFGITTGGVTEYINRLHSTRFAPRRDEVIHHLVKYRNIRNVFAHEMKAIKKNDELIKADLLWIKRFNRDLVRKKDPISAYLKKARRYARNRRIRRYLIAGAFVLLLFIVVIALVLIGK